MHKTLFDWLDARMNYRALLAPLKNRSLPSGPRWAYTTAVCLVWLLVVEMVTGLLLMMTYSPSLNGAWASIYFIEHSPGGAFIRGLHYYTAQAILILFGIHLLRVFLAAAFRAPRELVWLTGLMLMPLMLIWAITGNPLSATQKGMAQIDVEGNIIGSTPWIGPVLQRILIGGDQVGQLTLTHLYFLHVGLMPIIVVALLAVHLSQVIRHGVSISETAREPALSRPYWPYQSIRNMLVLAMVFGTVAILSWRVGAPLEAPADPRLAHSPRPEWYFLFLFELRRYFSGDWEYVATLVIPLAVLTALALMPVFDRLCRPRTSSWLRFATVTAGSLAWVCLTLFAVIRDAGDADYQTACAQMEDWAARARQLAEREGIPPEGAVALLRNDPQTQGPLLFRRHCAGCHPHLDEAGTGIAVADPSAPNLYGFASRQWLAGILDPERLAGEHYFGKTAFCRGEMVGTLRRAFSNAKRENADGDLRSELEKVALALSAEARLPYQAEADHHDAPLIAEGGELLVNERGCTECHRFHDDGELGMAPDLTGYGSREWLAGMIGNPQHERFYGSDRNDRMPAFAKDSERSSANLLSRRELDLLLDWLRREPAPSDGPDVTLTAGTTESSP